MDRGLIKIIRMLLDEIEHQDIDIDERLADLEDWKAQVEAVWPEILKEVDHGTD